MNLKKCFADDIFIGHFDNFYTDERGSAVGATESAFVKYAVRDIKNGVYSGLLKCKLILNLIFLSFNSYMKKVLNFILTHVCCLVIFVKYMGQLLNFFFLA